MATDIRAINRKVKVRIRHVFSIESDQFSNRHRFFRVAIVQIATRDKVFLLDLINLPKSVDEDRLKNFMQRIFCNEKLLKLGSLGKFAGVWHFPSTC